MEVTSTGSLVVRTLSVLLPTVVGLVAVRVSVTKLPCGIEPTVSANKATVPTRVKLTVIPTGVVTNPVIGAVPAGKVTVMMSPGARATILLNPMV